jgi:hypothetical protein
MDNHTSGRLAGTGGHSALRGVIAGLCVCAFLVVGFAHSLHHFGTASTAAVAWQAGIDRSDESPNSSDKAAVVVEHCLGCTIIAVLPNDDDGVSVSFRTVLPFTTIDRTRPHSVAVELPPPRFTA